MKYWQHGQSRMHAWNHQQLLFSLQLCVSSVTLQLNCLLQRTCRRYGNYQPFAVVHSFFKMIIYLIPDSEKACRVIKMRQIWICNRDVTIWKSGTHRIFGMGGYICPRSLLFFPLRPNFQNLSLFQAKATKIPFLHVLQAKTTIHVVYYFMGTHPFHSF